MPRGRRNSTATSARLPCYGAFRMPFRQIKTRIGLALAATACIAAVAAASAQAASAAPVGAFTKKGAWSFVSAPKLHPPKLITLRPTATSKLAPGYFMVANFKNLTTSAPMVGEGGPLMLDNKLQPVWFNPVGTNQLAGNLREQLERALRRAKIRQVQSRIRTQHADQRQPGDPRHAMDQSTQAPEVALAG